MAEIPGLEEFLKQATDKFETRKKWLILSELVYRPTSEKVITDFRYFACDAAQLMEAFTRGDIDAIARLPYALDEDGDRDTSSVLVDFAYTSSNSLFAIQPQEYQNSAPVNLAQSFMLEGDAAKALGAAVQLLAAR